MFFGMQARITNSDGKAIKIGFRFGVRPAGLDDASKCANIHMKSWTFAYSHCVPMEIIEQQNARRPAMWTKLLENCKDDMFC